MNKEERQNNQKIVDLIKRIKTMFDSFKTESSFDDQASLATQLLSILFDEVGLCPQYQARKKDIVDRRLSKLRKLNPATEEMVFSSVSAEEALKHVPAGMWGHARVVRK